MQFSMKFRTPVVVFVVFVASIGLSSAASAAVTWCGKPSSGAWLAAASNQSFLDSHDFPGTATASSIGVASATAAVGGSSILLHAASAGSYGASAYFDATGYAASATRLALDWSGLARRSVSLQVIEIGASDEIVAVIASIDSTAGSRFIDLQAGSYYRFKFNFASSGAQTNADLTAHFVELSNPGAAVLLATAGIVGRRRRT